MDDRASLFHQNVGVCAFISVPRLKQLSLPKVYTYAILSVGREQRSTRGTRFSWAMDGDADEKNPFEDHSRVDVEFLKTVPPIHFYRVTALEATIESLYFRFPTFKFFIIILLLFLYI